LKPSITAEDRCQNNLPISNDVIPAQAGNQQTYGELVSRLRGNDENRRLRHPPKTSPHQLTNRQFHVKVLSV
jgi:hypothetical protein